MEIQVTARPHMLLETVELLYAYINHIPPEELTSNGEYSLPPEVIQEMLDVACAGLSREDSALRYFFEQYILSEEPKRDTCIARNLVYDICYLSQNSVAADCERIRRIWKEELSGHSSIVGVGEYYLHWVPETEGPVIPVVDGVDDLAVDTTYIEKLRQQFADHDLAISRLEALVTPVAEKLAPLLRPWAQRAESLACTWQERLQHPESKSKLLCKVDFSRVDVINLWQLQLRYLNPAVSPGNLYLVSGEIFIHMGVDVPLEANAPKRIEHWELEALRLLGSDSRLKMLRALLDKPMSTRELAQTLGLNLGTVARDIRSMYDARLLTVEAENNRVYYRTNTKTLKLVGEHISRLGEFYQL